LKNLLLLLLILISTGASAQNKAELILAPRVISENPLVVDEQRLTSFVNSITVAVNTAKSSFTVDFKESIPNKVVTVAVGEMSGKVIQSETFYPNKREQTVTFPRLTGAGTYRLAVYADGGNVLYWGSFVKP
jgi:methionine-rich copper-binding protein CopC